ncbi:outer membrane efflux protein [Mariniflexile fucanivorans]|uniref:Outer membrane efflux protein n=1 Tax=Mariniflexile fucanivorans TaxID=264023 RepID=A0A4R1RNP9_9FLAO|nr:TolC family protein [Mariniflexile fucanivorans]TCL67938.1 outer membrane efflux protein [Mariniflexile fucanivorans]
MTKFFKIISIISFIVVFFNNAQAQTEELNSGRLNGDEFNFPPLKTVIDSVLKRSGMLNFRKHHIGVMESTLKSERIYWTKNFGIQAESKYGNINSFSTDSDGAISSSALVTTEQLNYSVGLYLKFPVFDYLNRKHQVKLARLELDEARSMADFQEEEIRQTVIRMYQDLLLKQKILRIKSKSLGDGRVNMEMVEKEFRNGVVAISEYVRITGMASNMEADYELAKSEFITAKQLLEDLAGFVFDLNHSN